MSTTAADAPNTATSDKNGDKPSVTPSREALFSADNNQDLRALAREEVNKAAEKPATEEEFNPFEIEGGTEEEVEETPTPEEQPKTETEEEEEEIDPDKPASKRMRIKVEHLSPRDRAIADLMSRNSLSFEEAFEQITGNPIGTKRETPPKAEEKPPAESPIALQEALIADLEKQIDQAGKDFKAEDIARLSAQLGRENRKLAKLEFEADRSEREQTTSAQTAYDAAVSSSKGRAYELFPDAEKPGTPLAQACEADIKRLWDVNPSFFNDPEWPETLAAKHAARLKIAPAGTEAPKPVVAPKKPVSRTIVPEPDNGNPPAVQAKTMSDVERKAWLMDPNTSAADVRKFYNEERARTGASFIRA